ncbi:hypothetical protein F418_p62 [Hafnia phage Enc34]|uniref:Uncharacterized protein n=1 Tax=Hafnia phage Enc34 TaxID=1150990 RepID=H6WYM4_9CAUD|nr:hypothetical protein F418_p62 [Hafnia phage Enc34]AFB84079.1 hypothetical protein [Hafnia phage Enc34]
MTLSINKERALYFNNGSCIGFTYADSRARAVLEWLKSQGRSAEMLLGANGVDLQSLSVPARMGTKKHYAACDAIMRAGLMFASHSGEVCNADLTPQLIGLEGKRVRVIDSYGADRRFTVGKSCGWLPCHLEMGLRTSKGGIAVCGAPFKSIEVIG